MNKRSFTILLFIVLALTSCSSNGSIASSNPTPGAASPEPKIEEAKLQVTENLSSDRATIILTPVLLLRDAESLFTATLRGEWDKRHARVEKSNREDQSEYKVEIELEWKSVKPFQAGDKELHFLADDQSIDIGRTTLLPMRRLEEGDSYSAWITAEIPLNYLERIATAQHVEMQLGDFKLTLNQIALSKLREFTDKALEIQKEQMSRVPKSLSKSNR